MLLFFVLLVAFDLGKAADPSHLVRNLPGQPQVGFKQYAGLIPINSTGDKAIFYWFYEADHPNSSSLPLVLWLNGGPACSSVGSALGELGPFLVSGNDSGLSLNPFSWNKAANLIFPETPAGVGFSPPKAQDFYGDSQTAKENLAFLLEWFKRFPEYLSNDFFIAGTSYAGHYIPTLAMAITSHNRGNDSVINFKGFVIGNPWTDSPSDLISKAQFLHSYSIISDEDYNTAVLKCSPAKLNISECTAAIANTGNSTSHIDTFNVYRKVCYTPEGDRCDFFLEPYLNRPEVQAALNVENRTNWTLCSQSIYDVYSEAEIYASMIPLYQQLISYGLRIWIYSGDVDADVPTVGTRNWINQLNLTIAKKWYDWSYENQVGGWTQVYNGLTFATVRGAGHMVPLDQPGPALIVFKSFLQGESLPASFPSPN